MKDYLPFVCGQAIVQKKKLNQSDDNFGLNGSKPFSTPHRNIFDETTMINVKQSFIFINDLWSEIWDDELLLLLRWFHERRINYLQSISPHARYLKTEGSIPVLFIMFTLSDSYFLMIFFFYLIPFFDHSEEENRFLFGHFDRFVCCKQKERLTSWYEYQNRKTVLIYQSPLLQNPAHAYDFFFLLFAPFFLWFRFVFHLHELWIIRFRLTIQIANGRHRTHHL